MRRTAALATLVTLGALCAPVMAVAEPVHATKPSTTFTTVDAKVAVKDGPADAHSNTIDTRLYVPKSATAATPAPAILITHGFGLTKLSPEVTAQASFLASHGYVVLTYTSSGFGASGGCITLQSADWDVKDAKQLITKVLEARPEVKRDAKGAIVGMVGGSYGGGITYNVAAFDPRVRAISPGRTWNALQYSLDPNNYVVPGDPTGFSHLMNEQGVFKAEWTSLFFALGNAQPVGGLPPTGTQNGGCPQEKLASGEPTSVAGTPCTGYYLELCEVYAQIAATGDADATARTLLARASGGYWIDKIKVPTLLVQGQSDTLFNENDAVATYTALKKRGVPVQMIWNSGGHGGYNSKPGECDVYGGGTTGLDDCYLTLRTLTFFDHWLRGAADDSPGFSWYQDWTSYAGKGANDEQYGSARSFPASGDTKFTLSGTDALVAPGKAVTAGTASFINPPGGVPAGYSETSNFSAPGSQPPGDQMAPREIPGQNVSFTSDAFTTEVVSVGIPSAHLRMSHVNTRDLVFFGKVYDVDAAGNASLIHRLIAPVRVPAANVSKPVDIKLAGFAHKFAAGHKVRLTLAATDLTSYNSKVPDQITVTTGGTDPSTFSLPTMKSPGKSQKAKPHVAGLQEGRAGGALATTGLGSGLPVAALVLLALAAVSTRRRTRSV
jgi:ABC-2 type transport system ATP-binding protein